jgi:SRSO17 transposase
MPTIGTTPLSRASRVQRRSLDSVTAEHFESFVAHFRPVFQRADQFHRFRTYVRGILESPERKNVEAIAGAASAVMTDESDLAQSLQHFVSHSTWDHRRLGVRLRERTRAGRDDPDSLWIVHDGVFSKKGRHSVGVHRQFARSLGKKINCQVGVFVSQFGPGGYFPLAGRLYLPAQWVRENPELAEKFYPERDLRPVSKAEIAVAIIDELREGERSRPILAEEGYASNPDFLDELAGRGLELETEKEEALAESLRLFDHLRGDFGLDHFEGRTWQGWHHHVQLVFTAYHFLTTGLERNSEPPR